MFEFLTASQNLPFTVALGVMFGIALLEGITSLFGAALSNLFDALLPDMAADLPSDVSGPEIQTQAPLSKLLGWLRIGQVPILMLLVIFLTAFGLIGLGLQSVLQKLGGQMMPGILMSVPAMLLALPVVRMFGGLLERFMPKDETDAVSEDSLVGRLATITLGTARLRSPAEARVRDIRGTTHYVMVEPDIEGIEFTSGMSVLLVRREGHVFKAITNTNSALQDN